MSKTAQQITAFVFGVFFLIAIIAISFFRPDPTPFQYLVFRTTLALAAAGVVAMVPGFLHSQVGTTVRAGGAVAAFVMVFFFSPAALVATPKPLKEHVGFLSTLDEHFRRHVSATEYQFTLASTHGVDSGRFWVDESADDDWPSLFQKICTRYSSCLACNITSNATEIRLTDGKFVSGETPEGAAILKCQN